jgi:hypothetical protein
MSLDLYISPERCPTCGHIEDQENFNVTYNVSRMWYELFPKEQGDMVPIEGLTGSQAEPIIKKAIKKFKSNKKSLEKLNPPNGWGSYNQFLEFLEDVLDACKRYPNSKWEAWR